MISSAPSSEACARPTAMSSATAASIFPSQSLFPTRDPAKSTRLMAALDAVNARFGRGTLRPLSSGLARPWGRRHARLSPRYTTRLDELLEAEAW